MKNELLELRKRVENGEHLVCNEGLFGGADLLITDGSEMAIRGEVVVITPYAAELSALIFRLKEICGCWLDYENKYAFYPELGIVENAYITEHSDLKGLLLYFSNKIPVAADVSVKDGTVTHFNIRDLKFCSKSSGSEFKFDEASLDASWLVTDLR